MDDGIESWQTAVEEQTLVDESTATRTANSELLLTLNGSMRVLHTGLSRPPAEKQRSHET